MKPQLMTREDAVSFILDNLKLAFPTAHPEPLGNEEYKIWFTETKADVDVSINLNETLDSFAASDDVNVLIDYLNIQVVGFKEAIETGKEWLPQPTYSNLFPIMRSIDFNPTGEAKLLEDKLSIEYKLLYAETKSQNPQVWVTQENLKPGYDHDKVVDKAFANLKARGWVKHKKKALAPGSKVFIFDHDEHPYQAQFLIKEWTDKHLGKKFYFTTPSDKVTLVMVPDLKGPLGMMYVDAALNAFVEAAEEMAQELKSTTYDSVVHSVEDGKIKLYEGGV